MTFEEDCIDGFKAAIKHLSKLIDVNAPNCVLAHAFARALTQAEGAFGAEYYKQLHALRMRCLRQYKGFCQHCDSPINVRLSYPPICEKCDHEIEQSISDTKREEN